VRIPTLLITFITLTCAVFAAECPKNQPRTEATLIEIEQNWAAALTRHEVDTVACMVADEFEEADVDGSLHTKKQMLDKIPHRNPGSNRLTEMRAHIEGNFGFTRGLNEVVDGSGKVVARVRFTDIFVYREGRWQAMAAHESLLGDATR